jgi:SAM-dependent methyltransferase
MPAVRRLFARHLVGAGVEIGPGHVPFPVDYPGTEVSYVDRWSPGANRGLFPELGAEAPFPEPDIVCNLDVDRLSPLADESQDFVIASHVLEHLAEPLGMLVDIHRVLRPGGLLLLLLPDRTRTFDSTRQPTPLSHLVTEHERGVVEVDDAHIGEFLERTIPNEEWHALLALSPEDRKSMFELHRQRSIHVHCWTDEEFLDVLLHSMRAMGLGWEFVDGVISDDEGPQGFEFGWMLRRPTQDLPGDVFAARLEQTWQTWREERQTVLAIAGVSGSEMERLRVHIAALTAELEATRQHRDRALEWWTDWRAWGRPAARAARHIRRRVAP